MSETEACRLDVWLWRARFFRTRADAAAFIASGRIRLQRAGGETRVDKPARAVRPGDGLVFAVGGRLVAARIVGVGLRRGPASEARTLYEPLDLSVPESLT